MKFPLWMKVAAWAILIAVALMDVMILSLKYIIIR